MSELSWPESIDGIVESARFGTGADFWESAEHAVARGLPDEALRYLAVVGLAELISQTHRIDRDSAEPCIGTRLVLSRYPELQGSDDEA